MIGVYHYADLNLKLSELEIVSGTETHAINNAYTLQATVLPSTLQRRDVKITPFTVFEVNGIFYRQNLFGAADNDIGLIKIDAVDLLFADFIDLDVDVFSHNATVQDMLSALLAGTKFTAGVCDDLGTREINMENSNKLLVLNKILELFDGELERNRLEVSIKHRLEHFVGSRPFRLEKGKNILTLEEIVDTSAVITKLRYIDSAIEDDAPRIITSPYIGNYPAKEGYKAFRGNADEQARSYLETCEQPYAEYKVTVPFTFDHGFRLGTVTQLFCEQIGINLSLRVVEITRDLTGQAGDAYILGRKRKSFVELTADMFLRDEISEDMVRGIIDENLERLKPEIIDEVIDRLDIPDLEDLLSEAQLREMIDEIIEEKLDDLDLECKCTDSGGGGHIILDHTPTQEEVDSFPPDSVILVYDPNKGGQPFGKTAYQSAQEGGFPGTEEEFNQSIASIGNVSDALTDILGEDI